MLGEFKVLHVNIGKRKTAHWSLFCDESLADFDALSVVEPYIYEDLDTGEPAFPVERNWQLFKPSTKQEGEARYAYRTAVWVNKRHAAQQVAVPSSDVVAATIPTKHGAALIVSAYDVKSTDGQAANEEQLRSKLQTIKDAYDGVKSDGKSSHVDLLLCADFNRHHELWGGAQAFGEAGRTDEAEAIIDFMQENALTSLLPSGTVTWEHYNGSTCSTIDILLASSGLSEACEHCGIHQNDHGSDHKAVRAHFVLDTTEHQEKRRRRMYDKADWKKVREEVSTRIADDSSLHVLSTKDELEVAVDSLEAIVNGVLEERVARARPSPYAKRWWTDKLTTLRLSLSAARNHLTAVRRRGEDVAEAATSVKLIRRIYMDKIEQCKREHWVEFLDNRENIWKAYAYTKTSRASHGIPVLKVGDIEVTDDREKADLLLTSFFPVPPEPADRDGTSLKPRLVTRSGSRPREYAGKKVPLRIKLSKLTLAEVEAAIMQSKSDKAPGLDEITFRVWKELWPVLGDVVVRLYQASLDLKHVPQRWRTAKIVVLRKPNKPDYSKPKAYRPISLLETIGKGLEAVVARRLSYLAETYRLLPENHFGGRPNRSAEQALNLLVEKIHEAWRVYKTLSLVSFDVQGAFNGVHPSVLAERLRERRVPGDLVAWIESFCNRRKASVVVGDYESPISEIEHAGILQGSPLSPILYVFYNANLVQGRISKSEGSIGFIDDYNAWVTGPSAAENTRKLQTQLLPRAEKWARESGAVFEAEKTAFIHFVRPLQPDQGPLNHLVFGNKTITPKRSVKILGVTLDSGLSMNEHVSKAVAKAIGKCMALRKIRGVRPAQMRQMYMAAVVPPTDYAASVWYAPSRIGVKRHVVALERVQRLASRLILRAYKSVAMLVLQSEAKLQSVSDRLHERVSNHLTKLCALPLDHPIQRCISWFQRQGSAFPSPLRAVYEKYETQVEPETGLRISERPSWVMPPWQTLKGSVLYIEPDEAIQLCRSLRFRGAYLYYAAAEIQDEQIGAAAIIKYRMTTGAVKQQAIAETSTCSLVSAELTAILYALEHARDTLRKTAHVYVATTSREALSAIEKGHNVGCGREVVPKIADAVLEMEGVGHRVTVFLVPGDKGIRGVAEAKQAARSVIDNGSELIAAPAERVRELSGVLRLVKAERAKGLHTNEDDVCVKYYTWKMDKAWSGKHTLHLYGALSSDEASILVQARTEHCGLNACLFRKKLAYSPACECGRGDETVLHVLLRCERYAEARKALREAAGDRWGDASYLLGGWSGRKDARTGKFVDGPRESWKPELKVVRASIRFLYQTGRLSRSSDMRVE
ncbi:hypothetical protein WHR41_09480 [Cladosporium halotolerans]|uniref:Reverse transcriptase domain-containing protein n=1 Tax=Cladosporium halotolerans TaxID=1052096 RepID=A0AB34K9W4_9PEZI